jgi:hypothetical protein
MVRASSGFVFAIAILLGLLAAVGWLAWASLATSGESIAPDEYVALAFGAFSAVLVGTGLIALVFYSNGAGYDEPPRFR